MKSRLLSAESFFSHNPMASVPVLVFNPSVLSVTVSVNNGPQFFIPGASAPDYVPQLPSNGGPGWSYLQPAQGTLAPGNNILMISPAGSPFPQNLSINLSEQIQWTSLQLYLVLDWSGQAGWLVLNSGSLVAGNLPAP